MVDACQVVRVAGQVTDPVTGVVSDEYVMVYEGPCRVQARALQGQAPRVGEYAASILRLEVHLPVSVTGVAVGDVVGVTGSADPDLLGRKFTVTGLSHKSLLTARRLAVEEVTA